MKPTCWLIWDASGSMAENGKRFIARGVARSVEQYCRLSYGRAHLQIAVWREEARPIAWQPTEEFPPEMLECRGRASARALLALLGEAPPEKVMLITDGWWAREEARALKRWQESLSPDVLRIVKVGADANPLLKGPYIFAAEEVLAAMDGWLEGDGDEW